MTGLLCKTLSRYHAWRHRARAVHVQVRHWRAQYFDEKARSELLHDSYMQALDTMVAMNADNFSHCPSVLGEILRRAETEEDQLQGLSGFYSRLWRQHVHFDDQGGHHNMFEM